MKRLLMRANSLLPTKRPVATQVMHAPEDVVALQEGEFPVLGFRDLAERNRIAPLVGLLRTKLGFPVEVFDQVVRPVIGGYAEFLQSLPAAESRDRLFCCREVKTQPRCKAQILLPAGSRR